MNAVAKAERRQGVSSPGLRELLAGLVLVLAIGAFIFINVWRGLAFINVGYQIRGLERKQSELLHMNRELEIERAMLSSPERIERVARQKLGMIEPTPDQIRIVR
ncbi:cell division protein FtsL [bacterium]|nr:MAG: cell division protein FtsL [bacterium]